MFVKIWSLPTPLSSLASNLHFFIAIHVSLRTVSVRKHDDDGRVLVGPAKLLLGMGKQSCPWPVDTAV